MSQWKRLVDGAVHVFAEPDDPTRRARQVLVDDVYGQIGQLLMELELLKN